MGTTHRSCKLKENNIPVEKVVKDTLLYNSICNGKDRMYLRQFGFDNLEDIAKIQSEVSLTCEEV